MRSNLKVTKTISFFLACIIIFELFLVQSPSVTSADEDKEFTSYTLELCSNLYGAGDYIEIYERNGEYFIKLHDLAFLAKCDLNDRYHTCDLTQGIWRVTIDFDNRIFDDGIYEPSDIDVYYIDEGRIVPVIELLSYFGATYLKVDLKNKKFYCLMPNYTAWEALDVNYELSIKSVCSNTTEDEIARVFQVLSELVMGDATTPNGYRKRVYDEVLKADMLSNDGVKEFIDDVENENDEFLKSKNGKELAEKLNNEYSTLGKSEMLSPSEVYSGSEGTSDGEAIVESLKAGDYIGKGLLALADAIYGHECTWLRELYSTNSDAGLLSNDYRYSKYVFDTVHDKITNRIEIAGNVITAATVLMNIANSTAAEIKAVQSTNNLIGHVMGNDELLSFSTEINKSWIDTAKQYNSTSGIIASNALRATVEQAMDEGIDWLLKNGIKKGGVAAKVGLQTGRKLMTALPFTRGSYESTKADLSAILLCDLQEELLKIIDEYHKTVDFRHEDEIQKLVNALILYCRTTMVLYQELLSSKEAEGFNIEYWKNVFQPKIDLAAIELYKLYTYSEDGIYRMIALNYSGLKENVSKNKGIWLVDDEITHENLDNETIITMFNDFIDEKECMYGKACTFTLQRTQNDETGNGSGFERWWEGITEGVILGYSIEDFDSDGSSELLLVTLFGENQIQFEMYEVINGEVTLADSKKADTNSSYGVVELPCGSRTDGGICGILSCFVQESNNRIFLQSSDSYGLVADGCDTFIVSTVYKNGKFKEYAVTYDVGSDIDGSIPRLNQELLDIGVPNPDFESIFYQSTPLIDCFDSGVHEILRAEQGTVEYERGGSAGIKIVTKTVFATQVGQIENPVEFEQSADKEVSFGGCYELTEGTPKELDLNQSGDTDLLSYSVNWVGDDHVKNFVLYVNDNSLTVENEFLPMFSFTVDAVYAVDMNIRDNYKNIICQLPNYVYIYAFDDSTIQRVDVLHGRIIPESINGEQGFDTYMDGEITDDNGNYLCEINSFRIYDLNQEWCYSEVGSWDGESINSYDDNEFSITLPNEHELYADQEGSELIGSIPAGERVTIIDFFDRGRKPMLYTYKVECDNGEGWIADMF